MNYAVNYYRFRKLSSKYFVTTDSGSWIILSKGEFNKLRQNQINGSLYDKLREREIILDETNVDEFEEDLRKRNSFLFRGVSLHIIVVTLRCNMKCVYCHASSVDEDKKGFDMDKKTAKKIVDFIFQSPSNAISIEFQGGEPLLNWDIVKFIISYAKEKNKNAGKEVRFDIVTNLSLMDDEKMGCLIDEGINVCTSLDGHKNLHDKNRFFSRGSNYERVVKWIKKFKEEYKKRGVNNADINALPTLTKESLKYPTKIVDEYVNLGLTEIHLRFLNNLGVAKKTWSKINYSAEEYLNFWKKAMERIKYHQSKGTKIRERIVRIIKDKIETKFDPSYLDLRSPCGAVIGQLVYHYNGGIFTCDEGRMLGNEVFMLGSVFGSGYKNIVTCDKACTVINASLNDQFVCDSCAYKPYCGLCPVCSFADSGNIISKVSESDRCKIFKKQFDWFVNERFIKENNTNKSDK